MQLIDLLTRDRVKADANVSSKKRLLELASELLQPANGATDRRQIYESLCSRERLGSTGLGHGVAIPHGRLQDLDQVRGAFLRLREAIDFDAPDDEHVDLVFAMVVPEQCTDQHLQLLAQIADLFGDHEFCERLRSAGESMQLYDLLASWQAQPEASSQTAGLR